MERNAVADLGELNRRGSENHEGCPARTMAQGDGAGCQGSPKTTGGGRAAESEARAMTASLVS